MTTLGKGLHVNIPLSRIAMQYRPNGMIADQIAPVVPVQKQADSYLVWSQADAFRVEDDKRSPATEANVITRNVSSETYFAQNYALKTPLTLEDRVNMDAAYATELRGGRAKYLKSKLMLGWEKRLADKCTSGSNIGSYSTIDSDWIEHRNGYSAPISDIWTAIDNVEGLTGYKPNSILMSDLAWTNFRQHEDVMEVIHGSSGNAPKTRYASHDNMKTIFDLDRFVVGKAWRNTAQEGLDASLSRLWSDYVLVYFAPLTPSIEEPSFMYSFRWAAGGLPNMQAEIHPFDQKTKAEEIELGYYQDEKITSANLGFLLTHVTSV